MKIFYNDISIIKKKIPFLRILGPDFDNPKID